jgi:endonuclease VIII
VRATPIAAALLDQSLVAGAGNVLRAEVLHALGVHPATPARDVDRSTFDALWRTLTDTMRAARDAGRIVTRVPPGESATTVPEAQARWVYKQEACRRCGTPTATATIGGRTAYWCPVCQPLRRAAPRPPARAEQAKGR